MCVITTLVPLDAFCGIMDDIMMNIQYDYDYHYDERMIMRIHDGMSTYDISEFIHDSDDVNEIIAFIHAVRSHNA